MVISYCIPIKNRLHDLKKSMVKVVAAARKSPPVEIVILDYDSDDGLKEYVKTLPCLENGNSIVYIKHPNHKYYHMAHARNLSMLAGSGEYLVGANADNLLSEYFFQVIRALIADGAIWMTPSSFTSLLICQKKEFIDAGGFDERFEFYGPEDKEIVERLERRGKKHKRYSRSLIPAIRTRISEKKKNYRLKLSRKQMHDMMMKYLLENRANNVLVANPDGWGKT